MDRDVVRVDPERRAVTARIPVGDAQQITIQPVGGELWAIGEQPAEVLRIDPATNRIAETIEVAADELAGIAVEVFGEERVQVEPRLPDALEAAITLAEEEGEFAGGGVLVTGSVITVGEARLLLGRG
jgi:hypothetical protein